MADKSYCVSIYQRAPYRWVSDPGRIMSEEEYQERLRKADRPSTEHSDYLRGLAAAEDFINGK